MTSATLSEESEARVVMLHKQGGLFRIIVQNLHEKVSDRFDTRGVEVDLYKHDASPPSPRLHGPPARAASIAARRT